MRVTLLRNTVTQWKQILTIVERPQSEIYCHWSESDKMDNRNIKPAKIKRRFTRLSIIETKQVSPLRSKHLLKIFFNKKCDEGDLLMKNFFPDSVEESSFEAIYDAFVEKVVAANNDITRVTHLIQRDRHFVRKLKSFKELLLLMQDIVEELGACRNFITDIENEEDCGDCHTRKVSICAKHS